MARQATLLTRLSRTSVPKSWRSHAKRHIFYYVSPLFYGLSGLLMGYVEAGKPHAIPLEPVVWVMQTILTYMSDVHTLGEDSRWHAADRLHAYTFTIVRALITSYVWWRMAAYTTLQMTIFFVGLVLSLVCIRMSWLSIRARSVRAFLFWHAMWHTGLPLTAVCIALLELAPSLSALG